MTATGHNRNECLYDCIIKGESYFYNYILIKTK